MNAGKRPARTGPRDEGLSLVEVVVSLLVFAILTTGVAAGAATIPRIGSDSRAREVATNLASQELDTVRSIGDPFAVHNAVSTSSAFNRTFTVTRTTSWVSAIGADIGCGSSTNLQYKRVHVAVSWDGKLPTTAAVVSDTLVAPNGPISDPTTGTIAVSVLDAAGAGESGVNVSIAVDSSVSPNSAKPVAVQPADTDSDGCTFATSVSPGSYTIRVSKPDHLAVIAGGTESPSPVQQVTVAAGSTASGSFSYDDAARFNFSYTGAPKTWSGAKPSTATNLTTLLTAPDDGGVLSYSAPIPSTSVPLFPYRTGYVPLAGDPTNCSSVDPSNWSGGTVNNGAQTERAGAGSPAVYVAPGDSGNGAIPVGVVTIALGNNSTHTVKATAQAKTTDPDTAAGDPGCAARTVLDFGSVSPTSKVLTIALPFGSWQLSLDGGSTLKTGIAVPTNARSGASVSMTGVVTLDPRDR